jgi:hypothetical protein
MPDRDIPKKVDEYVQQIKEDNPSYDDAQAWATAWSIYCKYKNPSSDHCHQPASAYFPGKGGEVGSSGPLMLRRDYGTVKQASTGQECEFFKARNGKWYMGLSDYPPEDDEEMDYWDPEYDYYGPFSDFDSAYDFLHRNFANPGGFTKDPSGRRPPPKKLQRGRYASAKRVVARYLGSRKRG